MSIPISKNPHYSLHIRLSEIEWVSIAAEKDGFAAQILCLIRNKLGIQIYVSCQGFMTITNNHNISMDFTDSDGLFSAGKEEESRSTSFNSKRSQCLKGKALGRRIL